MVNQAQIREIVNRIRSNYPLEKIILFGSYVYGQPKEDSDLDLLVVVESSDLPRHKRAREIRKRLWGFINTPKDILVYTKDEIEEWKDVKQAFITKIISKGRVLYENKTGAS
ncbi:MAG: nucleotidyltransferase domain-containing protein [Candidatus Omnitrophica bacterium]|nr:nucleotidyltransferase domain-containing protein [Candidatus Omnitrophota bacterium]MBU0878858.1 nucleotidyltransferase domain-containing protein [Candidatus Omnitrophota bacterium]MBU0896296.1 nucleotidyltransferase domain-containing protein [Candidatus Omnitrophota bacterium]MBU1134292.1 nucleotidyltransferase domain-containing protein [Candidatus Omnitrophota bacterium]MBU1366216.1 nucleotidyltransferase domain-containing protein [Candidatus Omnitrophota bacterium]